MADSKLEAVRILINLDVPDVEVALAFYTAAFGFRPGRRLGAGAIELLGGAVPVYLLESAAGSAAFAGAAPPSGASAGVPAAGVTVARTYERHWTPVHLDLVVPDVVRARERALAAGARPEGEIHRHVWGHLARLADPFGHGVCLIEFKNRGYDELVDV